MFVERMHEEEFQASRDKYNNRDANSYCAGTVVRVSAVAVASKHLEPEGHPTCVPLWVYIFSFFSLIRN